jgi:osmotically-inducible protein OsmY
MNVSKALGIAGVAGVLIIGPATLTPALAQTAKSAVAVDDSTLKHNVEEAIEAQPSLKDQHIDVKVNNGVVTLTGAVQSTDLKTRAATVARVASVTRVVNDLKVDPKASESTMDKAGDATKTAAKKTGEAAKTAGEKTGEGAKVVGEKTKDAVSTTGEAITDSWINTTIHAKMVDEDSLKGSDVNVDVKDHVVTLKGTVMTAAGKARAEQIAKTTEGVKSVHNLLTIGPKK